MREFREVFGQVKGCEVLVNDTDICGRPAKLELCNYDKPIPICTYHINKSRTRAQRRQSHAESRLVL